MTIDHRIHGQEVMRMRGAASSLQKGLNELTKQPDVHPVQKLKQIGPALYF
jgi:hypothetical protein